MDITNLIRPELLVLLPVLYSIGVIIKKNPNVKAFAIPFILVGISIGLSTIYCLFVLDDGITLKNIMMGIFQGIILGVATVGTHKFYKQAKESIAENGQKTDELSETKLKTDLPQSPSQDAPNKQQESEQARAQNDDEQ